VLESCGMGVAKTLVARPRTRADWKNFMVDD
jgi:hypothetical protein